MDGADQTNPSSEELTVRYTIGRRVIWLWYWRKWRTDLWKIHLRLFILFALVAFPFPIWGEALWKRFLMSIATALCCLALFPLVPMILYRSDERRLTISQRGIEVVRGKTTGFRDWPEIAAIADREGCIVIESKKVNSFIIPNSAFISTKDRAEFLTLAKRLWSSQNTAA